MNPVETLSAVPKPVKYILFNNNQMKMDQTIEKASMVMEALKAYSSKNNVDIMPANSSIKNGKIKCLSTTKSQNLFESTSTAQNFNPVFSNSSSFKVNDSWVRLQNTFDFTEPHPVAISNTKPSGHKIRFVKGCELPKDQSQKILLPNTAEPYPVGYPFMNDPNEFAEFKKHYTLSPKNKMFRNQLLASTKEAKSDKTVMDTILFNLVNICEKHVFDQNVHMQIIKNIVCEIVEIPGYEEHADKIRSQCQHILSETFNDMNGIVDQCVKLQNVQTRIDSDKKTLKTEPIPELNSIFFPCDNYKPKLIADTGYIKIEPEDLENEVDMPIAGENVEEENQMEFSTLDNQVKPIYNQEIEKIENENKDGDQIESEKEVCDQIESGNEDGCEIKSIYEDYVQFEWKNEDGGKIESEMEEEEYSDIERVYSENRTEQIHTLNFSEHSVEAQPDTEGYSDKISDNENESSELEESETGVIEKICPYDPNWQPDIHFESGRTDKRSREPKKPKVPKKSKERKISKEKGGICVTCGKNVKDLKEHLVTHMTERTEKCPHCDYRAKCAKSLRKHMAVHSSGRNFQCEKCGLLFRRLSCVRVHVETVHSKELPFSCQFCPNKYTSRCALQRHEKIHKKQYAFACDVCGKKFIQSNNLKTHMRTHTGEKPYKCDKCGEGFAHNVTKKLHQKTCLVEKVREKCDQD